MTAVHNAARTDAPTDSRRPPSKPVLLWAAAGIAGVAMITTSLLRWVTSSDFEPTDTGADSFGGWREISAHTLQYVLFAGALIMITIFLIRPALRERRLTFNGKLVIAGILGGYIEPINGYFEISLLYNANLPNMGSWAQFIPGYGTPNAEHFVQPPMFNLGAFTLWIAGSAIAGGWVLRTLAARYPYRSNLTLYTTLYAGTFVFALVFEALVVHSEIYVYPAIPADFALWEGSLHQYSLWTPFFGALLLTGMGVLHYLYNAEADECFADHGVHHLRLPTAARTALSTFAVIGFAHFWVVASWVVPFILVISLHGSSTADVPSYLRDEMCGPGTGHPCPGD